MTVSTLPLDRHIEQTAGMRGGRPRIAGTRITVADVVLMHLRLGQALEEIAGKYDLPMAALHAALAYYFDHRDQIDRGIASDEAVAEAFSRRNPSVLRGKLRTLNGE